MEDVEGRRVGWMDGWRDTDSHVSFIEEDE
jgi:hypothetical protein